MLGGEKCGGGRGEGRRLREGAPGGAGVGRGVGGGAGRRGRGGARGGGHGGTQEQYESARWVARRRGPRHAGVGAPHAACTRRFRRQLGSGPAPSGRRPRRRGGGAIFAQTTRACATLRQPWRRSGRPRPGGNSAGRLGRTRRRRAPRDRPSPPAARPAAPSCVDEAASGGQAG